MVLILIQQMMMMQIALDALGDTITDVFVYTITDEHGQTDTANLTITITGINDAPVAQR